MKTFGWILFATVYTIVIFTLTSNLDDDAGRLITYIAGAIIGYTRYKADPK